jgi:hypothetical protein
MYTDYHAEAYFLQISDDISTSMKSGDQASTLSAPNCMEPPYHILGAFQSSGSDSIANTLTLNPEPPAKHNGEDQ